MVGFVFALLPPQMANLAHRAHQLVQKEYLIIHPTADGKKASLAHFNAHLTEEMHKMSFFPTSSLQKKSIFSTQPNLSIT